MNSFSWLGYDAPDSPTTDAPFSHYANDGAPDLNRFMSGLDVAHEPGSESHTIVVGHSYGTTLIGSAARQGDLNADDIILAGSPGVQVGHATDTDVPEGHVWNMEADGDIVPDLGAFGHGGSDYWKQGKDSLRNQAYVVVGQGDRVELK